MQTEGAEAERTERKVTYVNTILLASTADQVSQPGGSNDGSDAAEHNLRRKDHKKVSRGERGGEESLGGQFEGQSWCCVR